MARVERGGWAVRNEPLQPVSTERALRNRRCHSATGELCSNSTVTVGSPRGFAPAKVTAVYIFFHLLERGSLTNYDLFPQPPR